MTSLGFPRCPEMKVSSVPLVAVSCLALSPRQSSSQSSRIHKQRAFIRNKAAIAELFSAVTASEAIYNVNIKFISRHEQHLIGLQAVRVGRVIVLELFRFHHFKVG